MHTNRPATPTPSDRPRIALIAHDHKKDTMVELAHEFRALLSQCTLCATGTTGGRLVDEVGLDVERLLSGPWGGDLQIGARLAQGEIDVVIFLRDPMTDVPCATNLSTARLVLGQMAQ
jgi:methylglyoxal synthase